MEGHTCPTGMCFARTLVEPNLPWNQAAEVANATLRRLLLSVTVQRFRSTSPRDSLFASTSFIRSSRCYAERIRPCYNSEIRLYSLPEYRGTNAFSILMSHFHGNGYFILMSSLVADVQRGHSFPLTQTKCTAWGVVLCSYFNWSQAKLLTFPETTGVARM